MRKKLCKLCTLVFILLGCQQKTELGGVECFENQHRVFLCYDNEIEGFEVNVMLLPQLRNSGSTCQAIIDLAKDSCHWQFMHNAFADKLGYGQMANDTVIHLHYDAPEVKADIVKLEEFNDLPFFFLDVDFDGHKELLLNLYQEGQHWANAFQPFCIGYDYLYDDMKKRPFTELDDLTEIDYRTNTIKLNIVSGANNWTYDIYKYKPYDAEYGFIELLEHYMEEYDINFEPRMRRIVCREDTLGWQKK